MEDSPFFTHPDTLTVDRVNVAFRQSANGRWMLTFDLVESGTYSEHRVSAEMTTASGVVIRSAARTVWYQYSPDPVAVNRITMYCAGDPNQSMPSSILDFKNGTIINPSYTTGNATMLTFVVEFDCPDVTLLSDVIVEVATDAGTVWEMSAVWDDECVGQICV